MIKYLRDGAGAMGEEGVNGTGDRKQVGKKEETSKGEETSRGWKRDGSGEVEAIDAATERGEAGEDGHQRGAQTPGSSRQDQDPFPPLLPYLLPTAQPENHRKLNDAKLTPQGIFFSMFFGASKAALKNCFEAMSCISEL